MPEPGDIVSHVKSEHTRYEFIETDENGRWLVRQIRTSAGKPVRGRTRVVKRPEYWVVHGKAAGE